MKKIGLLVAGIVLAMSLNAQTDTQFKGDWYGKLNTGAFQLRLVIHITSDSSGKLVSVLDSPDQGAAGIPTGTTTVTDKNLLIEAPKLNAKYEGTLAEGDTLVGKWTQGGQSFPLNLHRQDKPTVLLRPQEPKVPLPYKQQEVVFTNPVAGIELSGTLTIPEGNGPFPAVVLVTGSGPQNRNEELLGHKPFLVIADYLTRNGIAVLRYDDRGVGKSKGTFSTADSYAFADDAEAGFNYLSTLPIIDKKHIGIAGHSEGGLIAPIIAARNKDVGFIILIAGPGVTGEEILYSQIGLLSEKSGSKPEEINEQIQMMHKIYAIVKQEPDNEKALPIMRKVFTEAINSSKTISSGDKEKAIQNMDASLNTIASKWYRNFLVLDPQEYLQKVKCPLLAMNGSKDLQVPCDVNLKAIQSAMKIAKNKHSKTIKFEGLNHLFQHCDKGLPSEYGNIEETFAPEALEVIKDFIHKL
jgi:uncharacterized protein